MAIEIEVTFCIESEFLKLRTRALENACARERVRLRTPHALENAGVCFISLFCCHLLPLLPKVGVFLV
jgi:hypothetical protein